MLLVPITPERHGVLLDIAYATERNFTGRPIYRRGGCHLQADAAGRLERAVELAGRIGLRLKIFDAFRPVEAQWKMWAHTPDADFVADPRHGSSHNRGIAIDLTLAGGDGRDLDMGTGFDAFTPLSHHGAAGVPETAQRNRLLLLGLMSAAGFGYYDKEWWHYQLDGDRSRYPLLSDSVLADPMM